MSRGREQLVGELLSCLGIALQAAFDILKYTEENMGPGFLGRGQRHCSAKEEGAMLLVMDVGNTTTVVGIFPSTSP